MTHDETLMKLRGPKGRTLAQLYLSYSTNDAETKAQYSLFGILKKKKNPSSSNKQPTETMFCDLEPIIYFEEENGERETDKKREIKN